MPSAIQINCKVIEHKWLTPTVAGIRFEPSKKFLFDPGQFLSVVVPIKDGKPVRRIYSFASAVEKDGYQLCIKLVPGGPGSTFMCNLKPGDVFKASAPYGDLVYDYKTGRNACFIATGTGIAPFRSICMSQKFQENRPKHALLLFGARTDDEIVYPGLFESLGVQTVNAISKPSPGYEGFNGRVTDYLKSLPRDWNWHSTNFFLCGNGAMISEVRRILIDGHGVPVDHVHQEAYFERAAPVVSLPTQSPDKAAA